MLVARGSKDLTSPATKSQDAEMSDTVDMKVYPKALWINAPGVVRGILAEDADDEVREFHVVAGGAVPLIFRRIFVTGTTADFIPLTA